MDLTRAPSCWYLDCAQVIRRLVGQRADEVKGQTIPGELEQLIDDRLLWTLDHTKLILSV